MTSGTIDLSAFEGPGSVTIKGFILAGTEPVYDLEARTVTFPAPEHEHHHAPVWCQFCRKYV